MVDIVIDLKGKTTNLFFNFDIYNLAYIILLPYLKRKKSSHIFMENKNDNILDIHRTEVHGNFIISDPHGRETKKKKKY